MFKYRIDIGSTPCYPCAASCIKQARQAELGSTSGMQAAKTNCVSCSGDAADSCYGGLQKFSASLRGWLSQRGFAARPERPASKGEEARDDPMRIPTSASGLDTPVRLGSLAEIKAAEDVAKNLLQEMSQATREGQFQKAASYFSRRGKYMDLYSRQYVGAEGIQKALEKEVYKHENESEWSANPHLGYERTLDVVLPTGTKFAAVQVAFVEDSVVTRLVVKPKQPSLQCVLAFAHGRETGNTDAMLEQMTQDVIWKSWMGFSFSGQENVKKMLIEQKRRGEERKSLSDWVFKKKTYEGAIWERTIQIERDSDLGVKATQTVTVASQVAKMPPVYITANNERPVYATVSKISHVVVAEAT